MPATASLTELSLFDFIPALSRRFAAPRHLASLVQLLEQARAQPLRVVVSTPPRHGKTETLLHSVAWHLARAPATQVAYISYAQRFVERKSRKMRELARAAGVPLAADAQARAAWSTGVDDGGVWATSIGGALTGEGFHVMIVDDPVKDRATAESVAKREAAYDWFNDTAYSRLEPTGSCIVNMARWHPDDLAGRLIADGWTELRLPAVSDDGAALWPERWPLDRLQQIEQQLGPYGWNSLYQGRPRARGDAVFRDVVTYDEIPKGSVRWGAGLDLSYSGKTHAHWSVLVILAECEGIYYVVDVLREQSDLPTFAGRLRGARQTYQAAKWLWYTSSTEKGLADLLRSLLGFPLVGELAAADKLVRAQPAAAAWKAGRIRVPRQAPWLEAFLSEVLGFTGVKDKSDDQIDALAAAFDVLERGRGIARPKTSETGFTPFGGNPFAPQRDVRW